MALVQNTGCSNFILLSCWIISLCVGGFQPSSEKKGKNSIKTNLIKSLCYFIITQISFGDGANLF